MPMKVYSTLPSATIINLMLLGAAC